MAGKQNQLYQELEVMIKRRSEIKILLTRSSPVIIDDPMLGEIATLEDVSKDRTSFYLSLIDQPADALNTCALNKEFIILKRNIRLHQFKLSKQKGVVR